MASRNRISLADSMAEVWRRGGFTEENALRPIPSPNTSGPTAPLPDRFTAIPGGNAAGEFGHGLPSVPAAAGHSGSPDDTDKKH
ncbi:TPA: hypothetical protein DEA21_04265 [Candidatus Uhrbacteria bacterium]|nr:hypothetical protein [Candidatus Uhrbacteria bacterium]